MNFVKIYYYMIMATQIMMEWEKPYMEACIDKLNPYGRVLEIGFGLGYSANHIQTYKNIEEHVIVECAPIVWKKMIPFLRKISQSEIRKGSVAGYSLRIRKI